MQRVRRDGGPGVHDDIGWMGDEFALIGSRRSVRKDAVQLQAIYFGGWYLRADVQCISMHRWVHVALESLSSSRMTFVMNSNALKRRSDLAWLVEVCVLTMICQSYGLRELRHGTG